MTITLNIKRLDESKPHQLHCHYSGQTNRQDAYIALDIRDGEMWADYNAEIGNAIPMTVWHRLVLRWYMPPFLAATANRIMDAIAADAQRVLDGASAEWDGSNMVGRLDEDARDAVDDIGIEINTWLDDSADDICWQPGIEWLWDDIRQTMTAEVTDAEIDRVVEDAIAEVRLDAPAAVLDREQISDWYRAQRDGMRAEATDYEEAR